VTPVPTRVGINASNFFNHVGRAAYEDIRWNDVPVDPTTWLAGPDEFLRDTGSAKATVIGLAFGPDGLYFTTLHDTDPISSPLTNAKVVRVRYVGE